MWLTGVCRATALTGLAAAAAARRTGDFRLAWLVVVVVPNAVLHKKLSTAAQETLRKIRVRSIIVLPKRYSGWPEGIATNTLIPLCNPFFDYALEVLIASSGR